MADTPSHGEADSDETEEASIERRTAAAALVGLSTRRVPLSPERALGNRGRRAGD